MDGHPVEQLTDELRRDGEVDSAGTFSLDPEAAREKLAKHQFEDGFHGALLELARAAYLRGAPELRVRVMARGTRVSFAGRPFSERELAECYSAVYQPEAEADRSLASLAIAAQAAFCSDLVRKVRVRSGAGRKAAEAWFRRRGANRVRAVRGSDAGTTVMLYATAGEVIGYVFCRLFFITMPEVDAFRDCQFTAIPVYVGRKRVTEDPELPDFPRVVPVERDGIRGHVGRRPDSSATAEVHFLVDGVAAGRRESRELPDGLVAVVEGAGLRMDLSRSEVVRNDAYEAALEAVKRAAGSL